MSFSASAADESSGGAPPPPPPLLPPPAPATHLCAECQQEVSLASFADHVASHWRLRLEQTRAECAEELRNAHDKAAKAEEEARAERKAAQDAQARERAAAAQSRRATEQKRASAAQRSSRSVPITAADITLEAIDHANPLGENDNESAEESLDSFPEIRTLLTTPATSPDERAAHSDHVYTAASVYLYDSFHCRSIKHSTDLTALENYRWTQEKRWKNLLRWVAWIHLMLGFIEPPSSIYLNEKRYGPSHATCGGIELILLALYSYYAVRQYIGYGPGRQGFWRSEWRIMKAIVLIICIIDVIISMSRNLSTPGVHLSQILRVFFVLERSSRMRQLCS